MKERSNIVIDNLTSHIRQLISKYESIKNQNNMLERELSQQRKKTETYRQKIEDLKNKLTEFELKENSLKEKKEEMQLKEAFITACGNTETAKKSIAKIIAEIDSCIYLLDE